MSMNSRVREFIGISLLCGLLAVAVYFKLEQFTRIPGDVGDARLNNYFLENFYRFFSGQSTSLWNLEFFYPYPFVLGFSDNLFGTGLIYSVFRWMSIESDTSFQLWFLAGYLLNFAGAYVALRVLGLPSFAAINGALIFAFALPTTNHALHAQLHYRFGAALAIAYAAKFWDNPSPRYLSAVLGWLLYQFYCGVYIGFFVLLFLVAMSVFALMEQSWANRGQVVRFCASYVKLTWPAILIFLTGMVLLFYPYAQVKNMYGLSRGWSEISSMLPRLQSYFLADNLPGWRDLTSSLPSVPMRWEHQMFIGIAPLLLLALGMWLGKDSQYRTTMLRLSWSSLLLILVTLSVGGYSLWYLLHKAPLFSAIRVLTRWDQILLFPVAYIAAAGIARLEKYKLFIRAAASTAVIGLIMSEWYIAPFQTASTKAEWRARMAAIDEMLPGQIGSESVLFVAQRKGPFYADELDAMWAASNRNIKTLNGYSGNIPAGYSVEYGNQCAEIEKRLQAYESFNRKNKSVIQPDVVRKHLLIVGFGDGCSAQVKK